MKTWQCNNEYCGSNFKCVVITADDARPKQCPISWNSPQEFNEIGTIKNPEQETDA